MHCILFSLPFADEPKNYRFSSEEMKVIKECEMEALYKRCMPFGIIGGVGAYVAVQRGLLRVTTLNMHQSHNIINNTFYCRQIQSMVPSRKWLVLPCSAIFSVAPAIRKFVWRNCCNCRDRNSPKFGDNIIWAKVVLVHGVTHSRSTQIQA